MDAGADDTSREQAGEVPTDAANGAETASADLQDAESGDEIAVQPGDESEEAAPEPHSEAEVDTTESAAEPDLEPVVEDSKPKRGGWWQKRSFL